MVENTPAVITIRPAAGNKRPKPKLITSENASDFSGLDCNHAPKRGMCRTTMISIVTMDAMSISAKATKLGITSSVGRGKRKEDRTDKCLKPLMLKRPNNLSTGARSECLLAPDNGHPPALTPNAPG